MMYSVAMHYEHADVKIKDCVTWPQVTETLRKGLDQWVKYVRVYKFSSNGRCLADKCVTLGNIVQVATSLTDKVIL